LKKSSHKTARRYARALFELCEPSRLEITRQALFDFTALWEESPEIRINLLNPALPLTQRSAALQTIAGRILESDPHWPGFLTLLLNNKRLGDIRAIAQAFAQIVAEVKKLLSLRISSAFALPSEEQNSISAKISSEFGSLASIEWTVDPELIGGLRIKAGDRLLDGSLKGSLDRLRTQLMG